MNNGLSCTLNMNFSQRVKLYQICSGLGDKLYGHPHYYCNLYILYHFLHFSTLLPYSFWKITAESGSLYRYFAIYALSLGFVKNGSFHVLFCFILFVISLLLL